MMGFTWFWLVAVMNRRLRCARGSTSRRVLHLFLCRTELDRRTTTRQHRPCLGTGNRSCFSRRGTLYFASRSLRLRQRVDLSPLMCSGSLSFCGISSTPQLHRREESGRY